VGASFRAQTAPPSTASTPTSSGEGAADRSSWDDGVRRRRGAAVLSVSTPGAGPARQLPGSSADMLVGKVQIGAMHKKAISEEELRRPHGRRRAQLISAPGTRACPGSTRNDGGRAQAPPLPTLQEADEQSRATGCEAGGAKGGGQGECEPAKHAPDAGPGKRVTLDASARDDRSLCHWRSASGPRLILKKHGTLLP
jgi:hypothetical protein